MVNIHTAKDLDAWHLKKWYHKKSKQKGTHHVYASTSDRNTMSKCSLLKTSKVYKLIYCTDAYNW